MPSVTFALTLLYATTVLSIPTRTSVPYNVANPAASPSHVPPPPANILPLSAFDDLFVVVNPVNATNGADLIAENMIAARSVNLAASVERSDNSLLGSLFSRGNGKASKTLTSKQKQAAIKKTCVGSNANDTYISSLFFYGGEGTTVFLCPGAVIPITNAVFLYAANQTLATQGYPTDNTRATLQVTGDDHSTAIYMACDGCNGAALRNIQVDGNREGLGLIEGGGALIEAGGNTDSQVVDHVHSFEPRGWSALHAIEGYENSCWGMIITNNDVGPSGHAPSGAQQFRKRDNTGTYAPGQWADGISVACQHSTVTGNTITDATDGAIVIFGAPGTIVSGNTIIADQRQLLGGINMVDWSPFDGSYDGTVVTNNNIIAQNSMIKVGTALGGMVWGSDNRTASRNTGGTVQNNVYSSGNKGYFGYAIGIAGHEKAVIKNNNAVAANFGGVSSSSCFPQFPLPTPQSFIADPNTTPGVQFQRGFTFSTLVLLICRGPGKILKKGGLF